MKTDQQIYIFDTTLRDGQQAPGAGMTFADNLTYAQYANDLGIDILEAGFPSASQHDFDIVYAISQKMCEQQSAMKIAALCQLREEQVICTMKALQPSRTQNKARLHTYVPVDPNLMKASLGEMANDFPYIINEVYRLIKMAVDAGFEVEFSAEGYSRMRHHFDFTIDIIRAAVSAGASTINCPDTIGGASRWEGPDYFVDQMQRHADIIRKEFPNNKITWSAHCHNDFGLATANTMEAIFSGPALQFEGCMNGVGERAGNAALEQCIMIIDQFGHNVNEQFNFFTNVNLAALKKASDFIAEKMLTRQPHWPITGLNSARHSSGGHTNAILKKPLAYQPFDPKRIGHEISFAFGPFSGSNHAKEILEQNGFHCPNEEKTMVTQAIKHKYSDRRKGITDEELINGYKQYRAPIQISKITYVKSNTGTAVAHLHGKFFSENNIKIQYHGENSALAALDNAVKKYFNSIEISDYRSISDSEKSVHAKCHSTIGVQIDKGINYIGKATDADITISAMKAYINAVNQAYVDTYFKKDQLKFREY